MQYHPSSFSIAQCTFVLTHLTPSFDLPPLEDERIIYGGLKRRYLKVQRVVLPCLRIVYISPLTRYQTHQTYNDFPYTDANPLYKTGVPGVRAISKIFRWVSASQGRLR
jgi:hypothetical protein